MSLTPVFETGAVVGTFSPTSICFETGVVGTFSPTSSCLAVQPTLNFQQFPTGTVLWAALPFFSLGETP